MTRTTRRNALLSLAVLPVVGSAAEKRDTREKEAATPFLGSWFVTSAVTSLILSIEPQEEALFIFIENGAFSIVRTTWKLLPSGLLVDGFPRFRLWPGIDPENVRVEMEPLPDELEVSVGFRHFPQKFFMRRVAMARVIGEAGKRQLPPGWEKAVVDKDWDDQAGKRRDDRRSSPKAD